MFSLCTHLSPVERNEPVFPLSVRPLDKLIRSSRLLVLLSRYIAGASAVGNDIQLVRKRFFPTLDSVPDPSHVHSVIMCTERELHKLKREGHTFFAGKALLVSYGTDKNGRSVMHLDGGTHLSIEVLAAASIAAQEEALAGIRTILGVDELGPLPVS